MKKITFITITVLKNMGSSYLKRNRIILVNKILNNCLFLDLDSLLHFIRISMYFIIVITINRTSTCMQI